MLNSTCVTPRRFPNHQMTPIIKRLSLLVLKNPHLNPAIATTTASFLRHFSTAETGEDEWNDAWESAWLPDNLTGKARAPWETDVNFSLSDSLSHPHIPSDIDSETKAFVEEMTENWEQRKGKPKISNQKDKHEGEDNQSNSATTSLYKLDNMKKDYRLKKQRIHAGLWMKEIEKMEEAKLGESFLAGDNIDKLLDSCSEYAPKKFHSSCLYYVLGNFKRACFYQSWMVEMAFVYENLTKKCVWSLVDPGQ